MKPYSLVGVDGNAFSVMGYTANAMRKAGFSKEDIDKMHDEATSRDYNHLLYVCMDYVDKVNEKLGLEYSEEDEDYDEEDYDDEY